MTAGEQGHDGTTVADVRARTGALFGDLWHRYDDPLFEESVALFAQRFAANGFDLGWFQGKDCLDVGCGGGRYSIAMARLGAARVVGCDISSSGLEDARRRGAGMPNLSFEVASALDLPFPDGAFDFVCCSGVLHHTPDARAGLREIFRVLRPGGKAFLLLYGKGGVRWPTIMRVRPHAQAIGYERMDRAMRAAGLAANHQRTFLDDLFVPLIDFYSTDEVERMLDEAGFGPRERWTRGKLDHESSIEVQTEELRRLERVFDAVGSDERAREAAGIVRAVLEDVAAWQGEHAAGRIDEQELNRRVFGFGHHRMLATKP